MEFLNSTAADLLTFQQIDDEIDRKTRGGISVSSIMDMRLDNKSDYITGGSLAQGVLRDTYIPIGLYLDDRLPKQDTDIIYGGDCNYAVIDDTIYDRLIDNISLKKKYASPKTLKLKSIFSRKNDSVNKTIKNIKNNH